MTDVVAEWTEMMRSCGYNMDQPLRNDIEQQIAVRLVRELPPLEVRFAREAERKARADALYWQRYRALMKLEALRDRLDAAVAGLVQNDYEDAPSINDHWKRLYETGFHIEGMVRNKLHPPTPDQGMGEDRRCA